MGYRYLDRLATEENIGKFVELADLAAGAGSTPDNLHELMQRLRHSKPMQLCEKRLVSDPASAALIAARHVAPPYDVDALRKLPRGTLGHTFASVIQAMGYDINYFPNPEYYNNLSSNPDYINYRLSATHDLHHILTGFNPEVGGGELGVLCFGLAKTSHPSLVFLNLMWLLMRWIQGDTPIADLDDPKEKAATVAHLYRTMSQGMDMGFAAKPVFPVLWEERMAQDLEEIRHELGIVPVREGIVSWEANPRILAALAS